MSVVLDWKASTYVGMLKVLTLGTLTLGKYYLFGDKHLTMLSTLWHLCKDSGDSLCALGMNEMKKPKLLGATSFIDANEKYIIYTKPIV